MASGPPGVRAPREPQAWGVREWLLLGAIGITFVVVPFVLIVAPPVGLSFRFAYLVLPLLPAVGLACLAVWVALPREGSDR